MKSTSGMCVTLGVGNFISSSKIQKLNSKSSPDAEIISVSDEMNILLWLADFHSYQGLKRHPVRLEQDNQSCIALLNKGRSTAETTQLLRYGNSGSQTTSGLVQLKSSILYEIGAFLHERCNFCQAFAEDFRKLIIYFIDLQLSYFYLFYSQRYLYDHYSLS